MNNTTFIQKLIWLKASVLSAASGAYQTVTGAIASFVTVRAASLKSLVINVDPVQDLHGYAKPWPPGGGDNLLDPALQFSDTTVSDVTLTTTDGYQFTLNGTATAGGSFGSNSITLADAIILPAGTYYANAGRYALHNASGTFIKNQYGGTSFTVNEAFYVKRVIFEIVNGKAYNNDQRFLGLKNGSTGLTAWSPYSNICPISGRTGADIWVKSAYDAASQPDYSLSWSTEAGTVYAGSADVTTGKVKSRPEYAAYNGETLTGPWLSSMDEYAAGTTPTTGAQVVDLGGTETSYGFTAQQIDALEGQNYVWASTGNVTVTYRSD